MTRSADQDESQRPQDHPRAHANRALERCIIQLIHDPDERERDPLRGRLLQRIAHAFSDDVSSIAVTFDHEGPLLLVNPDFFMELDSTSARAQLLRHAAQHLLARHPARAYTHGYGFKRHDPRLYELCAELEVMTTMARPDADGLPSASLRERLGALSGRSAEQLYDELKPRWDELQSRLNIGESLSGEHAELYALSERRCPCERSLWAQLRQRFTPQRMYALQVELDRLILLARESLMRGELTALTPHERELERALSSKYNLNPHGYTLERRVDLRIQTEAELNRVLVNLRMREEFTWRFVSTLPRLITSAIKTMGVGLFKGYIALLVNPDFFLNQLQDTEERGAVVKHEALHVMLKHVILARDPHLSDSRIFNVAADLEVNQLIGAPWRLPEGALTLESMSELNLEPHRLAEEYYETLMRLREENPHEVEVALESAGGGDNPSNHEGWSRGDPRSQDTSRTPLSNPLSPTKYALTTHELEIERLLERAFNNTSSRNRGSIPGRIKSLLETWREDRASRVDWRRALRLFVSSNPNFKSRHTSRKRNKRYAYFTRRALRAHPISADALSLLGARRPKTLPALTWGALSPKLRARSRELRPALRRLKLSSPLPWSELPRVALSTLLERSPELSWPTWDALTDAELTHLKLIRTPLTADTLPTDVYIALIRAYPERLPPLGWPDLSDHTRRDLERRYPHLKRLSKLNWSLFPIDELPRLREERPELFVLTWSSVPPQLIAQLERYQLSGGEVFRIDRVMRHALPGIESLRNPPKLLIVVDTSSSVDDDNIALFFDEIDVITRLGAVAHVLEVDAQVQLYYEYQARRPKRLVIGRGGTDFNPAIRWLHAAREGVMTSTLDERTGEVSLREIMLKVDGLIYLTDGYAPTPTIKPPCRVMWA